MAATIGSLALLISAQTAPLEKDMKKASKIAGDGAKAMKDEVDRKGTLWGSFFRAAFAVAMFKRMVKAVREGTEALKESGDAGAEAAAQGLKRYDDAVKQISMTAAKALAPALGKIGEVLAETTLAAEALVDVWQFGVFRGGDKGLDEEFRKRDMIQRQLDRQKQFWAQFGRMGANRAEFEKRGEPLKKALDDLVPAWQKHLDFIDLATRRLLDQGQAAQVIKNDFDALLKTMGLAVEEDPFAKWGTSLFDLSRLVTKGILSIKDFAAIVKSSGENLLKSSGLDTKSQFEEYIANVEKLNQLRRAGAIDDLRLAQLVGMQVEKLAEAQEKLAESKGPEALIRGTAAAFSALNEFQRARGGTATDAAAVVRAAAAKAEAQRAEQIRLGQELLKEERQTLRFKVMGF